MKCDACGKEVDRITIMNGENLCDECLIEIIRMSDHSNPPTMMNGWICPKCGRVNSPYVDVCPCSVGYIYDPIKTNIRSTDNI